MNKHLGWMVILVLALGWLFDFLFWKHEFGANFAIYAALVLAGGFALLLANDRKPALRSLWLLLPAAFFGLMSAIHQEPVSLFLAYLLTLFSMAALAVTYLGGRWPHYSLLDYIAKYLLLALNFITGPQELLKGLRHTSQTAGETRRKISLAPIIRGLLLALPVVIVFTALLASADLVFSREVSDFLNLFDLGRLPEYILRLGLILAAACALSGVYLYAASKSTDQKLIGEEKPVIPPFIGLTESAIVLASVDLLFLAFVIIQFQYFFGGNANIHIDGYTYSEYARRGFAELVIVAVFSLALILGLSILTRRETPTQRRIYSTLSILLAALVSVILVSSFQRLNLVIDYYGFTRLRLYPLIFMIWLGILLAAVVILEALQRQRYFALAMVLAVYGFAATLMLYNVDAAAVRHNVWRASLGKPFDPAYLAEISTDAVPALAEPFANAGLSTEIHQGIGAALICHQKRDRLDNPAALDWRAFSLSRWQGRQALARVSGQLDGYWYSSNYPPSVSTPGGAVYSCSVSGAYER